MRTGAVLPDHEVESFRLEWKDLEDRFAVLIREKTNFWLPWSYGVGPPAQRQLWPPLTTTPKSA